MKYLAISLRITLNRCISCALFVLSSFGLMSLAFAQTISVSADDYGVAQGRSTSNSGAAVNGANESFANETLTFPQRSPNARDPFALTPFMLEIYNSKRGGASSFVPAANIKVPELALKGLVRDKSGEVVALLEVGSQGVFMVRAGDTVGFRQGVQEHVLRVTKIDQLSIVVEAGNLGRTIVVR